ncbi:MAG: tRNA (adenine-N(6)-)-methyltransferase [Flavobacteriales bacterium]|nr:tRNA (adenine-N(6)-)-methyltransferase [Flavobacteriales bacterium]|tara:strand:+ start:854 stop:1579 length:726 start_codon:yes stop_codon:yes gene_type:complete
MKFVGPFQMKQFTVEHDNCAMRVNTDGCLLGALAGEDEAPHKIQHILDIGTGSGVIALQMAQRFEDAFIDAVEIHGPSAKQASKNFMLSPWSNRMICYHEPLQEFESGSDYDLIISNPPYFENGPTKSDGGVANARHALTLDFNSLIEHTSRLLKDSGSFWCVLPAERAENMIDAAIEENMHPSHIYFIKPKMNREANRLILKFTKEKKEETDKKELVLYDSPQQYTHEARELLAPFYKSL